MIYEGVKFITEGCRGMSRSEFIRAHVDVFWLDRDKPTRKKMLEDVFDRMFGKVTDEGEAHE